MARGGRRAGRPGTAYTNRSDLTPAAATGQPYGVAAQQIAAQQAIPMGTPTVPPPATAQPATPTAQPLLPGQLPPLDRPTERPHEPVTAGAATGAGPGPEALQMGPPTPQMLGDLLGRLAQQNPDLAYLASVANSGAR